MADRPSLPELVITRAVSDHYAECVRPNQTPLDVDRAREQHANYIAAFRELGVEVHVLPALHEHPDACFVEDVAVLLGNRALITSPGVASRRAETAGIEAALADDFELEHVPSTARLEGGDVMRAGERFFVGASTRTDPAGIDVLTEFAAKDGLEVVPVSVNAGLHLKSACTVLDARTLIYAPDRLELEPFRSRGFELIEAPEPAGANVLAFGEQVMVSAAAPKTAELLQARGHRVVSVEIGEFHTGDAALSCLSLRKARAAEWTV